MPKIYILGGGTFYHVRPHLSLCAPAFGSVARNIDHIIRTGWSLFKDCSYKLILTKMADGDPKLETNADISNLVDEIIADPDAKVVFFSTALCDYEGFVVDNCETTASGKNQPRLKTGAGPQAMLLLPADKIIGRIRAKRKDIFLIGFKTTAGATPQEQYEAGLLLLKKNSCNLVLANDLHTKLNMTIVPELGRYHETTNRDEAIRGLVDIANKRYNLSFTRTTIEDGQLEKWDDVPETLRTVVDYCVERGAYQAFNNVTVGHFGYINDAGDTLMSSRRKQNYNLPGGKDLVAVKFTDEKMIAYGAKPSAGTRSQHLVLKENLPKYNCIVHFHCPLNYDSPVNVRSQYEYECGSQECGVNTLQGIKEYGNVAAVMLDQHGPNIIFNASTPPKEIIDFIEENFDLTRRTGDYD